MAQNKKETASRVRMLFNGVENRFLYNQPKGPASLLGASFEGFGCQICVIFYAVFSEAATQDHLFIIQIQYP